MSASYFQDDEPVRHQQKRKKKTMPKEYMLRMMLSKALSDDGPKAMCDKCGKPFSAFFVKDVIVGFETKELCDPCRNPDKWKFIDVYKIVARHNNNSR